MTDFSSREPKGWGEMGEAVYQEAVSQAVSQAVLIEEVREEGGKRKLYRELVKKSREKRRLEKRMKVGHREQDRRRREQEQGEEAKPVIIRKSKGIIVKPPGNTTPSEKCIDSIINKVLKDSKKNLLKEVKTKTVINDLQKPFVCSICDKGYEMLHKAVEHMSKGHQLSKGSYQEFKSTVPRGTTKCDECEHVSSKGVPHLYRHKVSKHGLGVKENGYIRIKRKFNLKKSKSDIPKFLVPGFEKKMICQKKKMIPQKKKMIRQEKKMDSEEGLRVAEIKKEDIISRLW